MANYHKQKHKLKEIKQTSPNQSQISTNTYARQLPSVRFDSAAFNFFELNLMPCLAVYIARRQGG